MRKKAKQWGIKVPFDGSMMWIMDLGEANEDSYADAMPVLFDTQAEAEKYLEDSTWMNAEIHQYVEMYPEDNVDG